MGEIITGILLSNDYIDMTGQVDTRNKNYRTIKLFYRRPIPEDAIVNSTVAFELVISRANNYYGVFKAVVHRNPTLFNPEDRAHWYLFGKQEEQNFVQYITPLLPYRNLAINPEKQYDETVIDLIDSSSDDGYADLKTQKTPFFTCAEYPYLYRGQKYDPNLTISFNRKDYENYRCTHWGCNIYIWVSWNQLEYTSRNGKHYVVQPLQGVWLAKFSKMAELIEKRQVSLHEYINRKTDDRNAKDSYLFMLNDQEVFVRLV